jgi:hypothetical protein
VTWQNDITSSIIIFFANNTEGSGEVCATLSDLSANERQRTNASFVHATTHSSTTMGGYQH